MPGELLKRSAGGVCQYLNDELHMSDSSVATHTCVTAATAALRALGSIAKYWPTAGHTMARWDVRWHPPFEGIH